VGPHIRRYRNDCSVEAIFLSTFILSSTQNRMAAAADGRAELDVQIRGGDREAGGIDLRRRTVERPAAEHEEIEEMKRQVAPEEVPDAVEKGAAS